MSISMYQASVPVLIKQLAAVSAFLAKAEAHAAATGIDPATLLEARLAPDMFALTRQVQIATDLARNAGRLAGEEPPSFADEERDFAQLRARVARTIAYLESLPADAIDGSEERTITLKLGGQDMSFQGQSFLLGFILPNIFFHSATAYGLLRREGVPIGKLDFLGGL